MESSVNNYYTFSLLKFGRLNSRLQCPSQHYSTRNRAERFYCGEMSRLSKSYVFYINSYSVFIESGNS